MIIRREQPADVAAVHQVHDEAFSIVREQPLGHTVESEVLQQLRADPAAWIPELSLILVDGDELLGHVVASRGVLHSPAGEALPVLGLGPIAVRPASQRRGGGTLLVHALVAAADARDEAIVVLLGDPAYYHRHGFVLAQALGVTPPVPGWAAHFQVRTLIGYDPAVHRGGFTYPKAFDLAS